VLVRGVVFVIAGENIEGSGSCYSFGASVDLEFAVDIPIVPFNSVQGEEESLANLTIREALGNELEYF
jgi:hypothetical protein